ncbi:MAG: hypothetical protein ACRDP5_17040 [Streptosporangiaceae bacterium]
MPILIAAVIAVGGLCLLDLLLTFGVIRRLREHTGILAQARVPEEVFGLAVGQSPEAFSAVTTSGDLVSNASGLRVVAFLASFCSICPQRVPPFLDYLTGHYIGRDSVLVVVAGDASEPPPYVAQLDEVSQVCFGSIDGEVNRAFGVRGFPMFGILDATGALIASGPDPSRLAAPATV